jgi:cell division protein FtsI (penicillin-binding protein 3)
MASAKNGSNKNSGNSGSKSSSSEKRLYFLGGLLILWAAFICARLINLQVVHYGDFEQRAQRQQQRTIEVSARRGVIFDRSGHELAMSVEVDSAFAVPSEISDQEGTARILSKVLHADSAEILARFKSSHAFCWVARKLDPQTADRIRALNLKGIYFQKEPKRFYPKREMAAQVVGYVGMDDEGLGGIERGFDSELRGAAGKMLISRDARGHWFGRAEHDPDPGQNIVLTVDEKIQYIAERELDQAMRETRAEAGTVIVQNPHTGEILALANRPTFNPNNFHGISQAQLKNRAVSDIYEPGSTFKIVTIAAALEEKVTRPEEVVDCQMGSIVINGMRIHDHKPYGLLNVEQIIANSSDVGAIKIGLRLGEQRFDQYIRAFGFGSQTGIELPAETRGLTKPVSRWSKVSIGAISMGQEIGISAVQLAGLISTIANNGVWVAPRIIKTSPPVGIENAVGASGTIAPASLRPADQRRVISSTTAEQMKKMLQAVVQYGTGPKAQLEGYSAAGKTGTAQKVDPATGAYSKTKYVASFAGFAPVHDPAVTIVVILDSAIGLHQGGQVSAPVFSRIAQQVLAYMNVPHDLELQPNDKARRQLRASAIKEDDLAESSPDRLSAALDIASDEASVQSQLAHPSPTQAPAALIEPRGNASARMVAASLRHGPAQSLTAGNTESKLEAKPLQPPASSNLTVDGANGGTVVFDVNGGTVVPSFVGKPLRSVIEEAQEDGIEIDAIGTGVAKEQAPAAGTRVPAGAHVAVRFAR